MSDVYIQMLEDYNHELESEILQLQAKLEQKSGQITHPRGGVDGDLMFEVSRSHQPGDWEVFHSLHEKAAPSPPRLSSRRLSLKLVEQELPKRAPRFSIKNPYKHKFSL